MIAFFGSIIKLFTGSAERHARRTQEGLARSRAEAGQARAEIARAQLERAIPRQRAALEANISSRFGESRGELIDQMRTEFEAGIAEQRKLADYGIRIAGAEALNVGAQARLANVQGKYSWLSAAAGDFMSWYNLF